MPQTEKKRRYNEEYRRKNRDVLNAKRRLASKTAAYKKTYSIWYKHNREQMREAGRIWRKNNKVHLYAYKESWRKKHWQQIKHKWVPRCHARRARLLGATIGDKKLLAQLIYRIRTAKIIRCHWCNSLVPRKKRHIDHVIPLARGGTHCVSNLCCACATCNLTKGTKLPHEFMASKTFQERLFLD